MSNSLSDLLHAARTLTRARAFTAVCVVSLGLGMGVVIAILLLMRIVTATPPRVNDKGLVELVIRPSGQLRARAGSAIIDTWSLPDYLDVRDAAGPDSVERVFLDLRTRHLAVRPDGHRHPGVRLADSTRLAERPDRFRRGTYRLADRSDEVSHAVRPSSSNHHAPQN